MNILITGFEPFGGQTVNPSQQVVNALAADDLHTAVLPVDGQQAAQRLISLVDQLQPNAVICLGEAIGRARLSIERVAINLLDYGIPDNAGNQVRDQPIVADGPAAYFTTLPVRTILTAVQATGVPAELSLSAGTFLCNQVTYCLLHHLAQQQRQCVAGFVHLPALPEQIANESRLQPSMSVATMVRGIEAACAVLRG